MIFYLCVFLDPQRSPKSVTSFLIASFLYCVPAKPAFLGVVFYWVTPLDWGFPHCANLYDSTEDSIAISSFAYSRRLHPEHRQIRMNCGRGPRLHDSCPQSREIPWWYRPWRNPACSPMMTSCTSQMVSRKLVRLLSLKFIGREKMKKVVRMFDSFSFVSVFAFAALFLTFLILV